MDKTHYRQALDDLATLANSLPDTPMMARAKILALVIMNMRYEREVMLRKDLTTHPYVLTRQIIEEAHLLLRNHAAIAFIEQDSPPLRREKTQMEAHHEELFQQLWVQFSDAEYQERIERYRYRLRINQLDGDWMRGKRCMDFGCGHGNFAHALLQEGASYVYGLDFGANSIRYALRARDHLKVAQEKLHFEQRSIYDVNQPDNSYDFAIQNGVFHHLDDEDKAYRQVHRILKPGGWFWIYTDGANAITHDLWDTSIALLRNLPSAFIVEHLEHLNIQTGKRYHLGDGLQAVYRHETYDGLLQRLSALGFGHFRRLRGGFPTDWDDDVIAADPYGKEKFGDGQLRVLAQKL